MGHSFDEAFAREFDSLYGYLRRRLGNSAAEDLAADTFAIAYRRWQDLDPRDPFGLGSTGLQRTSSVITRAANAERCEPTRAPA